MIKVMACFKKPEDPIEFMNQFETQYLPLVERVPGVETTIINKIKADHFGKDPAFYLIHEMHFVDKAVFRRAMESQENQVAGRKLMTFADGYVTLLVAETQ